MMSVENNYLFGMTYETESEYSFDSSVPSTPESLPVEFESCFDNMVGTSLQQNLEELSLAQFAEIEAEHSKLMGAATLQQQRKLGKKFTSLLQVNGISGDAFAFFEENDAAVRMQLNIILFKANLNVQTVMSEFWEEVADVMNINGETLRNIMDHEKRLKNFFDVKFQEYAGALSWDLSPKKGSPVAVRAIKKLQAQKYSKQQAEEMIAEDLAVKAERVEEFKTNLWTSFHTFCTFAQHYGADIREVLENFMHPNMEESRQQTLDAWLESAEIKNFTVDFVESNGLVCVTKKKLQNNRW